MKNPIKRQLNSYPHYCKRFLAFRKMKHLKSSIKYRIEMIDVRCPNFQRMMKQFVLVRWCDQIEEWERIRFKVNWICNVLFYNWQFSSIYWMHCSWRSHRYFSDWKFWFFNKNAKIPRYLPWFYMANVFNSSF